MTGRGDVGAGHRGGFVGVVGLLALCGCDVAADDPTKQPPAVEDDECVEYTPDEIEGAHAGTWVAFPDQVVLPIDIGDPGGGLVRVTVTVADGATTAVVRGRGAPDEEVHYGVDAGVGEAKTETFVFRAQGDTGYDLILSPFASIADGDDGSYAATWTYEPNVDCYEHNQTVEAARRIPLDRPIQAYAHAGIVAGDGTMVGPGMIDFYRIELAEPTRVRLAVIKPDDDSMLVELWDPTIEYAILGVDHLAPGDVEVYSEEIELASGTHYVRIGPFVGEASTWNASEPLPDRWNTPYTLTVQTR